MHSRSEFHVVKRTAAGDFLGIISGMGRNRGTWDSAHGRSTAYRHAAALRAKDTSSRFAVEPVT